MMGVLLRCQGWTVAYLGQNVPLADLAAFIEQDRPGAVVTVGMHEEPARQLANWPKWIKQTSGRPVVTFAERAFVIQPELRELVPGIYLGDTIHQGLIKLEELL